MTYKISQCFNNTIFCLLFFTILLNTLSCKHIQRKDSSQLPVKDTIINGNKPESIFLYGIPTDSFNISKGIIKPNTFLSDLLSSYGISSYTIDSLVRISRDVFDVRKIRANHEYIVMTDYYETSRPRYFIYKHEPGLSYIFSFNDSLNITPYITKPESLIKFSSFTIETSLWDAIEKAGVNPELATVLSEIFAWTVDFFGLQKGDKFKVIYEEKVFDDNFIVPGTIFGASFISGSREYMAIPLIQDMRRDYYDADGTSLRRAFLKAPLKFSRISSRYSSGRMHPILRIVRPHYGVDYAAPVGTPVYSVGDGKVTETGSDGEAGKYVKIKHNSVYSTAYLHLSSYARGITPGAVVKQGDLIGFVGSSGLSTGPHLDFRFYKNGYPVDPLKVEAPPSEPVKKENIEKFNKIKSVITLLLSQID